MTLYESFRKARRPVNVTEFVKVYKCTFDGEEYDIIMTKRVATVNTVIHCSADYIAWEQVPTFPRLAGKWDGEKTPIYRFVSKPKNTIFLIKGRPGNIIGLDDGIFRSANRFDKDFANIMRFRRFKKNFA